MARKLKVFRTPTGFHDAYVAAPSQKAALKAWGADANLFARGLAEEVGNDAFTEEALARPGEVIRKARGTTAEHMAVLPKTEKTSRRVGSQTKPSKASVAKAKTTPRPRREELEAAETALSNAEDEHSVVMRDLSKREAALAQERRQTERDHARLIKRLETARDEAEARYETAIAEWRVA